MSFTLAIVGRPNVGKSTLFNRLVGRRLALVDDQPGVTRDLREGAGRLGPLRFTVLDSAGLEEASDESLQGRMRALTLRAVEIADVCLFLIDARAGVLASDETFAEILRRTAPRVIVGANKAEGRAGEAGMLEAYALGLGTPVALSAEHGEGLEDLLDLLMPIAEEMEQKAARDAELAGLAETDIDLPDDLVEGEENEAEWAPSADRPLQMAVMGRPNSGKSTLINAIIGEERLLTGPEAGITRDAIGLSAGWGGTPIRVFDTAGMRKKSRIEDKLEKMSVSDGLRAVRFAEVVVVLLDGQIPFETQDLRIADLAEREGRAVVVGINKWDLEENKQRRLSELKEMFERLLPQLRGAPMIAFSAKTGRGLDRLHEAVLRAHQVWNRRISTARLNRWLEGMLSAHPPPAPGGRRIRIRYMTQVKARPPAFVAMCSHPDQLPESYKRYLVGGLREAFDMPGTPIRLYLRSQGDKNPYKDKKVKKVGALTKHKRPRRDG